MIFANDKGVAFAGSISEIVVEVGMTCEKLRDHIVEKDGRLPKEDVERLILETVAFALCSEEEQEAILMDKLNTLMKGESNE